MEDQLARIREWAQATVDALQELPWATRRSQHVIALIDEMVASQTAAVTPPGITAAGPVREPLRSRRKYHST